MATTDADIVVVGGGIIGLATAHALTSRLTGSTVAVLDKESRVAAHQTGHNSGVLHSGIYYQPGSLKSRLTTEGSNRMVAFCTERGIGYDRCGKLVVATNETERTRLADLSELARANRVAATNLSPPEAAELEPHVRCIAALHVPSAGRADFAGVARALAEEVVAAGGVVRTQVKALRGNPTSGGWRIDTSEGPLSARFLVGCAGLQSDRLARHTGSSPTVAILPFRGEYLDVAEPSASLVRGLVYPVPDARFPFLGVHLTRGLDNRVHAGPNAVLALAREGYRRRDVSLRDIASLAIWPGTSHLVARHWRPGLSELARSLSRHQFTLAARRLVPDLDPADLSRGATGVRAQAVDRKGRLVDDFELVEGDRSLHVVNAPSPAATAALSIGDLVADRVAGALAS
ncbi:MAG: L-2-hydroxyglutarate oxidase [Actinomycetota bacterium]|nr:L-2-hydroxyglutarate oxidase [Actinomycetota bacterium]